jgi:hypothetical protein
MRRRRKPPNQLNPAAQGYRKITVNGEASVEDDQPPARRPAGCSAMDVESFLGII